MKLARRLCPSAFYIKGDHDSYSQHSRLITQMIQEQVPVMEKASIDEFYIDMTGMDRFFGCEKFTKELRERLYKQSGLPISCALAANKLVSKVATHDAKPDGQTTIPFGLEKPYLAPLSIRRMPGVGEKTSALLERMGVENIRLLSEIPPRMMQNLLGKSGIDLSRKANGIDESPVIPYTEQKSIGTENTFESDTIDMAFLHSQLVRMTEKVGFELRQKHKLCGCITVKLRYANFDTVSRQCVISYTSSDEVLLQRAKELFAKLYEKRMLVRLIGVKVSHLVQGHQQIDLFQDTEEGVSLYQAIDWIKNRYGEKSLTRAITLTPA
ncbi:DNA polymerase-4 [Algoriphagus sp. 4150]|nr:DNA polymerase-4 [Algoriphagus sp. 4150]